jgi:hypothetical protein
MTVEVTARDQFGNTATGFTGDVNMAITAGTGSAGAVLSGTTTVGAVAGVATFSDLSIDLSGVGYTLDATSGSLTQATSAAFDITVDAFAQLAFTVQPPASAEAGTPFAVEVTAQDLSGNTVTSFTGDVTMTIGTNPGSGVLSGIIVVAAVNGVATFGDLSIEQADVGYQLQATSASVSSSLSSSFDITPGQATALSFTAQPNDTDAGLPIGPVVEVTALDAFGNTDTGFTGAVTVAIANNAGSPPGTLSGTLTQAALAGVATFTDLSIDMVGSGYTLSADASGLTGATSAAFDILVGTATQLAFTQDPTTAAAGEPISPAVQVAVLDSENNVAVGYTGNVTVAITVGTGTGGATLSGMKTVAAQSGVATFNDLSIDKVGTGYTLTATSGTLTDGGATDQPGRRGDRARRLR